MWVDGLVVGLWVLSVEWTLDLCSLAPTKVKYWGALNVTLGSTLGGATFSVFGVLNLNMLANLVNCCCCLSEI